MSFTSSEIQKKLERGAFSIHIALKRIEALKAEISAHEEHMYETARSLYDNESLVDAAISMAQMSIPALEMRASKLVAENTQSSPDTAAAKDALGYLIDASLNSEASSLVSGDVTTSGEDIVTSDSTADGAGLAKIHADEFFGVEVPASQLDFAREIKREAAVSVKQNTKNNTYASDRGKNAWRKSLFARARADYLKNGIPADGSDASLQADAPDAIAIETVSQEDIASPESVDSFVDEVTIIEQVAEIEEAAEAVVPQPGEFDEQDFSDDVNLDQPDLVDEAEPVDEYEWSSDPVVEKVDEPLDESSEPVVASLDNIPAFDEPLEEVVIPNDGVDTPAADTMVATDDDHTFSIADTFFADDEVPVLDPITFDDEVSSHDGIASVDEPEDINIPEFDPNAELFDEDTPVSKEDEAQTTAEPVEVRSVSASVDEHVEETPRPPVPQSARRAVPISSIPAHQRPGAPRPQTAPGAHPVRPQPGGAPGRVVTAPGPRPAPTAIHQAAVQAAVTVPVSVPTTTQAAAPSSSRVAPVRTAPARTSEASTRTHGYGAKVPAPPGLDEAIREREASATKTVTSPSVPARPVSTPVRPSPTGARGPLFTKPSFNR